MKINRSVQQTLRQSRQITKETMEKSFVQTHLVVAFLTILETIECMVQERKKNPKIETLASSTFFILISKFEFCYFSSSLPSLFQL